MTDRPSSLRFTFWGAILLALMVALGAFGAHGLARLESVRQNPLALGWWQTGALYHGLHALGLLALDRVAAAGGGRAVSVAGAAFFLGILIFSGSLYALALTDARWLGAITPIGGTAFIVGWVALAVGARRARRLGSGA